MDKLAFEVYALLWNAEATDKVATRSNTVAERDVVLVKGLLVPIAVWLLLDDVMMLVLFKVVSYYCNDVIFDLCCFASFDRIKMIYEIVGSSEKIVNSVEEKQSCS